MEEFPGPGVPPAHLPGSMAQGENLLVLSAWPGGAEWFAVPIAAIPAVSIQLLLQIYGYWQLLSLAMSSSR